MQKIVECVPNFSEGRNTAIIEAIAAAIESVENVKLLNVDPGKATNRTVYTFTGTPEAVEEAAFQAIAKATELIDMRQHKGEHPRFGATDVCPFIPVAGVTMEECVAIANRVARRVGETLQYPVFLYESAATRPERVNLATVRAGEYEGLEQKLKSADWKPDYGPATFVAKTGATAIGARDFLIAVNFNLNTTSVRRANAVAFDVREAGRVVKEINPTTGETEEKRQPGMLKACKAIGWYIEEYGIAQVSMNLTNISITSVHDAFEAVSASAAKRGMRVTGTEIVGMIPFRVIAEAGKHFLKKQQRSTGVSDEELIKIAVKSMGLDELAPFIPEEKILEYKLNDAGAQRLINMDLKAFSALTASEAPAPGGGSIAAYCGTLAAALGAMVANLSSHKRGWDERWEYFSDYAEKFEKLRKELLYLVDEDTRAFDGVMQAFGMPKNTDAEKQARTSAIQLGYKEAVKIPFQTMEKAAETIPLLEAMVLEGNPNSITDAAVGVLCARTAVYGAYLNVMINLGEIKDMHFVEEMRNKAAKILTHTNHEEQRVMQLVAQKMGI